ncbi:MAG: hypothetical protein AAFR04_08345 [Pseudomonadota bacterium]
MISGAAKNRATVIAAGRLEREFPNLRSTPAGFSLIPKRNELCNLSEL